MSSVTCRRRFLLRRPSPHCTEHRPHDVQSLQVHTGVCSHRIGHDPKSSSDSKSQAFPPLVGYAATRLRRFLSPLQWLQAPQSPHSPNAQSVGGLPTHSIVLHSSTTIKAPSQAFPPPDASLSTGRDLVRSPPLHDAEQPDQADQVPRMQSSTGGPAQATGTSSPSAGLHGAMLRSASAQPAPSPLLYRLITRWRSLTPKQVFVQLVH